MTVCSIVYLFWRSASVERKSPNIVEMTMQFHKETLCKLLRRETQSKLFEKVKEFMKRQSMKGRIHNVDSSL